MNVNAAMNRPTKICRSGDEISSISFEFGELGCHLLADFYNCSALPHEAGDLELLMLQAARASGATIVESTFHRFNPIGLSGVVVIAESHLACHTWPEHNIACIDFFSCSRDIGIADAIQTLWTGFGASELNIQTIARGIQTNE